MVGGSSELTLLEDFLDLKLGKKPFLGPSSSGDDGYGGSDVSSGENGAE